MLSVIRDKEVGKSQRNILFKFKTNSLFARLYHMLFAQYFICTMLAFRVEYPYFFGS